MSEKRIAQIMELQKEGLTNAQRVIDNDHAYIHLGKKFSSFYKATIAAGQTLLLSITTPVATSGYVHFRGLKLAPSADKVSVDFYEGATINVAGTALEATNRSRTGTPTVSPVVVQHGTTFTANGTLLAGLSQYLPGSTGTGNVRVGSQAGDFEDEVVLKANTTYRVVITNGSAGENVIGVAMDYYVETGG